jgi:Cof subfamily protein (haloacid dehalogenase superfamily)
MVSARVSDIKLVLSDVDGTLVTTDKVLTDKSIQAVHALGDAGITFALTSARPPQGLAMFVKPLNITTPLAAFNGGLITDTNFKVLEEKAIDDSLTAPIVELLQGHQMSVWVYQGADWYVLDASGPHVEHEAKTCEYEPTVVANFDRVETGVTKIVGVSDDATLSAAANDAMQQTFGGQILATRSQSYFLDVTHAEASKGNVVKYLSKLYAIPTSAIATIGDMHNDLSMFAVSGLSIAMGNADDQVQRAARDVTTSNDDEGFANAIKKFVLST